MAKKRITELTTETTLKDGQYVAIDHATDGTKKYDFGGALTDIKEELENISASAVPTTVRQAIKTLFESGAYADTGLTDEMAVISSWASQVTAITLNQSSISISGATTSQLTATTTPAGGTVTWSSSDTSVATVSSSGLVTGVSNGTATITATSGDVSATCAVTVSGIATLSSISAVYTQSGTVYDTDTLDSLKTDLVVTATYSDSSTATVASADYTLSGTLTEGTSTITVSYGGKTTTFTVTVTHVVTQEVITTFTKNTSFSSSTLENTTSNNDHLAVSTINASSVNFTWNTEDAPNFTITIGQYNSSGNPDKLLKHQAYASSPVTNGSDFDNSSWWGVCGTDTWKACAIGGGNMTINLPSDGIVKIMLRKGSDGTVVNSNAAFWTWLQNGGLTITVHV